MVLPNIGQFLHHANAASSDRSAMALIVVLPDSLDVSGTPRDRDVVTT